MTKSDVEIKCLIIILMVGYILNLIFSITGYLCLHSSNAQMLHYQIGNAFAISASVMAARYAGLREQHVASSAYVLLGITHGISLGALSKAGINIEREATMAIPMIPALIFMFWCNLFPMWLKVLAVIPITFFMLVYVNVHSSQSDSDWTFLSLGYCTLQVIEVLWAIYLFKDWKQRKL